MQEVIIDPEFAALIPPMAAEERAQLEVNLIEYGGARDPLVVWAGILIDGHNRYEICTRLELSYAVQSMEFADREAAKVWMIDNQLGRRNLPAYVRVELALAKAGAIEAKAKANLVRSGKEYGKGCQKSDNPLEPIDTKREIAQMAGVSHDTVAKVKKIREKADPDTIAKVKAGELSINQVHQQIARAEKEQQREERRAENREKLAEIDEPEQILEAGAKFATIVIDPPWDWGDEGDQDQMGRARPDYATLSLEQLEALPVGDLADDDAHVYLWITNRSLPKGFRLLEAWGFRYVTALTWVKPHFGMGNYFRGQTEHVLFGVRGSQPLKRKDVGTVFNADRGKGGHSSKPPEFLELVESCSPGPFLEMFSRADRAGWKTWGENGAT